MQSYTMIENTRSINAVSYAVLLLGCIYIVAPIYFILTTSTLSYKDFITSGGTIPLYFDSSFFENVQYIFTQTRIPRQIFNSAILGFLHATGSITFAVLMAYVIVFFTSWVRKFAYATIIIIILVPGDTLTIVMYQVASNIFLPINTLFNMGGIWEFLFGTPLDLRLNILNTYAGMSLPLMIEAGATLVCIQYFRTIPKSMMQAAHMDGAGPFRFLWDIVLPMARPTIYGLYLLMFMGGWNGYFWPLIASNNPNLHPALVGLRSLKTEDYDSIINYPAIMTAGVLITLIPLGIVLLHHRTISRGIKL